MKYMPPGFPATTADIDIRTDCPELTWFRIAHSNDFFAFEESDLYGTAFEEACGLMESFVFISYQNHQLCPVQP